MAKLAEIVRTTVTAAMASAMPSTAKDKPLGAPADVRDGEPQQAPERPSRARSAGRRLGCGEAAAVCFEVRVWLTISEASHVLDRQTQVFRRKDSAECKFVASGPAR